MSSDNPGTNHTDAISIKIGSNTVQESNMKKLLSVVIDNSLIFVEHISKLCQKVSNKIYTSVIQWT